MNTFLKKYWEWFLLFGPMLIGVLILSILPESISPTDTFQIFLMDLGMFLTFWPMILIIVVLTFGLFSL